MPDDLWWRAEDVEYIRRRGERYPGAMGEAGPTMSETSRDTRIDDDVRAIREEYAEEEAEAAEAEVAERSAALDVPLNLRITRDLDARLRRRAAAEQIPMSALVRRLITRAVQGAAPGELTEARVEEIARRVVREESSPAGRARTP